MSKNRRTWLSLQNIYNRNQNKLNINNLQSYENNLQNVTKKNYDLIFNQKKRKIHERKNSAFNILKSRRYKKIEGDDEDELINNKNKEKFNETDILDKKKINDIKSNSQKNLKNKSFYYPKNNFEIDKINKKDNLTNFPNLSHSPKKIINNLKEYDKNYKENYFNLRNFLGHLYYMNKKYKLTQNIPHNLILGSSKYASGSSSDSFKDQVNNLINKLKTKNKENIHKNTLNLCVVNNSPVNIIKNNLRKKFANNFLGKIVKQDIVWCTEDDILNAEVDPYFYINGKDCANLSLETLFKVIKENGMYDGENIIIPKGSKVIEVIPESQYDFTFKLPNNAELEIDVDLEGKVE